MPLRTLRYCPTCLSTEHAVTREKCGRCDSPLLPLLDERGALSANFLSARGTCCDTGCTNCPYPASDTALATKKKTCERCGVGFGCCQGHCWCEDVRLNAGTLKWLQRTYTDCLCPTCLAEFALT